MIVIYFNFTKNQLVYFIDDNEVQIGIVNKIITVKEPIKHKQAIVRYYLADFIGEPPYETITLPIGRLHDSLSSLFNFAKKEVKIAKKEFLKYLLKGKLK